MDKSMTYRLILNTLSVAILALFLVGCTAARPRLDTVKNMELEKFMGKWYVIATIPVFIEAKAFNETEEYNILPDGSINTVLTFNQGGLTARSNGITPAGS